MTDKSKDHTGNPPQRGRTLGGLATASTMFGLMTMAFAMCSNLIGCGSAREGIFLVNEEPPALYDRYTLGISGGRRDSSRTYGFKFDLQFRNPVSSSLESIDTIPVLVIDSICVEDSCSNDAICRHAYIERDREKIDPGYLLLASEVNMSFHYHDHPPSRRADDLYYYGEWLYPEDYFVPATIQIPFNCGNDNVALTVFTSLFDRATGHKIRQDVQTYGMKLEQFSVPHSIPYFR